VILFNVIRWGWYALVPLLVLLFAILLSCVLAFLVIKSMGDVLPLQKLISKFTQLLLVLSIFPAMKLLDIDRLQLGFACQSVFFKQLRDGFALGLVTLLPVFVVLYVLKINVFNSVQDWTLGLVVGKLLYTLLLALLISLLEEPLFRGILLVGLGRKMPVVLERW
jgi:hypothetical protein